MGRRDAETAEHARLNSTARDSKAWEVVRRALGKLIGHVAVHDCGPAKRTIAAQVLTSEALAPMPVPLGRADWQPAAAVLLAPVPSAGTGLRESALLPAASLAQGDYALSPSSVCEMPVVTAEAGRIESAGLVWPVETTRFPPEFLHLPAAPVRVSAVALLAPPGTKRLTDWHVERPTGRQLRLPRVDSPRVRWGSDRVIERMALTRRAVAGLSETALASAEKRLADASHLPPDEVTLLGVYPGVPILAVSRIVVEGEGRLLRLWLKPEVLRARAAPHRITLLVGRQNSNGKMLQAAL